MSKRDDRLERLEAEVLALVDPEWKDVEVTAGAVAIAFVRLLGPDLEEWKTQLASGELDESDLQFLIKARMNRADLAELKRVGLAKAKRDKLVNGVAEVVAKALAKLA